MNHTEELPEDYREHTVSPPDMKKKIWRTFWILFGLTVVDITIYFWLLGYHSMAKNLTFIFLGIAKAYFIVGIFMHLKFERKWLVFLILFPLLFIIYFIIMLITEGNYISIIRSL